MINALKTIYSADYYIAVAILFAFLSFAFFAFVITPIISVRKYKKRLSELDNEPVEEPPLVEINARVFSRRCGTKMYGSKSPRTYKEFYVTFLTDDGEKLEYKVEEDFYLSIYEDQTGTLAIVNGNFYDFCAD